MAPIPVVEPCANALAGLYQLAKPALFRLDPERIHNVAIDGLARVSASDRLLSCLQPAAGIPDPRLTTTLFGLEFPGPIGMAAGFDKNATAFPALFAMGFDFVEIGTVTPLPQPGNPKPRMWRLPENEALINRMGFPSAGMEIATANLKRLRQPHHLIGCNVGPNKSSVAAGTAADDCIAALTHLESLGDYFAVNISSPNTARLRDLQGKTALRAFLHQVLQEFRQGSTKPVLLKISPDLSESEIADIVEVCLELRVSGLIATNSTIARPAGLAGPHHHEQGGLSGAPLQLRSLQVVATVHRFSGGALPIITVGGISTGQDVVAAIRAGASLCQIYTSFVYRGPRTAILIRDEVTGILGRLGVASLQELRGVASS